MMSKNYHQKKYYQFYNKLFFDFNVEDHERNFELKYKILNF